MSGVQCRLRVVAAVPGLYVYEDFVSDELGYALWNQINNDAWETKLTRRTQQYEYDYDYKRGTSNVIPRKLSGSMSFVTQHINTYVLKDKKPMDRVIVNEYTQKQGIASHTDRPEPFGDVVMSLSLGSEAVMDFTGPQEQTVSLWLPNKSLVILSGPARYDWTHGIKPNIKQEGITLDGQYRTESRGPTWRRISITWRSGR